MFDKLFVLSQYLVPQHGLSRAAGRLADTRMALIRDPFIHWFARHYEVDMSEAADPDLDAYSDFNSFFTRALRPGLRPIDTDPDSIVSPVDGSISQLGRITDERIFQAKGQSFTTTELLGGDQERAAPFRDGSFATIYLSPRDYHRIHMPVAGTLTGMVHIPGRLFSVNPATTAQVPRLFARNERVACLFDTEWGPMALVLVGAMIVASVETVWSGLVSRTKGGPHVAYHPPEKPIHLDKGDEMGRFRLGSTVVMAFAKDHAEWLPELAAGQSVKMGERFGMLKQKLDMA